MKSKFSQHVLSKFKENSSFNLYCFIFQVKPVAVHILTKEKFVSADKRYEVECKSSGSRPEAILTWHKGNRPLKRMAKNVSIKFCKNK